MRIILPEVATVDFETFGIQRRPQYPPKPVGLAVREPGGAPYYMAFGHPTENNSTFAKAKAKYKELARKYPLLFHNSRFDTDVAEESFSVPLPRADRYHDTLFLAFLNDPRANSYHLKDLADFHLGMPPTEQDDLRDWILENVKEATDKNWGAYICRAPGKLVGRYAIGDVVRTWRLYKELYPIIQKNGMGDAYRRELELMPVVLDMERGGVRVDTQRLKRDLPKWQKNFGVIEQRIYKRLGTTFNIGSSAQLAAVLAKKKLLSHTVPTKSGLGISTKVEVLEETLKDQKLLVLLKIRSVLAKYIGTYGEVWLERALRDDDYIFPRINQVRSNDGGAYTGRFSMFDPSLHNVPRKPKDELDLGDDVYHDGATALLPFLRDYLLPDPGCVFNVRDYSQQELRILAHYERGALFRRYLEDPTIDAHDTVRDLIVEILHILYPRSDVKTTNFGIIYGMGIPALSRKTKKSPQEARQLKKAVMQALPGARQLMDKISRMASHGEPIRTWGGRVYYVEEPKMIKGRIQTFEYKLLNTLIQGSAADCTKQAMINYAALKSRYSRLTLQVHDELAANAAKARQRKEMAALKEAMETVKFDVLMLSDGKVSDKSWGAVKKVNY